MATQHVTHSSRDLLAGIPPRRAVPAPRAPSQPPELAAARALCRQIRRKRSRSEKQRIAHLICLNLVSMLKRGASR